MSFIPNICRIENVSAACHLPVLVDALRLDLLHPIVSGNKWFKLKEYLKDAKEKNKKVLVTFGGAYSNHIVATAAAAQMQNFKSIGIIRGEKPPVLSHTLSSAKDYGMDLFFALREDYKLKTIPNEIFNNFTSEDMYIIPEGGYGEKGMLGAAGILSQNETSFYSHIITAVGTGTTLAGITLHSLHSQKTIGISVLKNNFSLQQEVETLLPVEKHKSFQLLHDYHCGGYAKYTDKLLLFMNELYSTTGIPTDFVYTGKAFFALADLVAKGYFSLNDKVLIIHTGGLQGNFSLPKGTLIFG
jgi:1-aminocyclopropane-1-carboxylate deaminase